MTGFVPSVSPRSSLPFVGMRHLKVSSVITDPEVTYIIEPARKTTSPEKANEDLCRRGGHRKGPWPTEQANTHNDSAPKLPTERIANRL